MSEYADRHARLWQLWEDRGRGPVIPVIPQYERPDYGYCPARTKDYAFRKEE